MSDHHATTEQLEAMRNARRRLTEANEAIGDTLEPASQALTDLAEAAGAFQRAVHVVLYGSPDAPQRPRTGTAYELSNDAARAAWPTSPPGGPGGG